MGIQDRDWYHDRLRKRRLFLVSPARASRPKKWLPIVLFWLAVTFLLFRIAQHFERNLFNVSGYTRIDVGSARPTASQGGVVSTPPEGPSVQVNTPPAPPSNLRREVPAPPGPAVAVTPQVAQKPSTGPTTLYFCKAYSGGTFWSTAYCGTQQAVVDRTASVPSGMSFEQQVALAEAQRAEAAALYNQQASPAVQAADRCAALKRERDVIEGRYANWQWQPLEVINPDQTRMKGLRAEQSRLGCPTQ